jgi:hypothetical protein
MNNNFIESENDLKDSVVEFFSKSEYWKVTIGNAPRYFVHIKNGETHSFGLSKFCAFKDISVEDYIAKYRYTTNGGNTQKKIVKITNQKWISRQNINNEIRNEFDSWILSFHPNYNLENASFISINQIVQIQSKKSKFVTPENLEKSLLNLKLIGEVGEEIAFDFEYNRLHKNGVLKIAKILEHVSKNNSAAGFDIRSSASNDNRYIEVKSSVTKNSEFFITENEYETLKQLKKEAYIYFVHVENLKEKKGKVIKVINNPIYYFETKAEMKPVVYKVKLK